MTWYITLFLAYFSEHFILAFSSMLMISIMSFLQHDHHKSFAYALEKMKLFRIILSKITFIVSWKLKTISSQKLKKKELILRMTYAYNKKKNFY